MAWPRVETRSAPAPFFAAIATQVSTPPSADDAAFAASFTFTADGSLDTLFSDTVDLPGYRYYRGLFCSVAGNLKIQDQNGNICGPFAVPAGVTIPLNPKRIYSTGTTCTGVYPYYGER